MWVFFAEGFVSIVQKRGDIPLCVRARTREDLEAFGRYCRMAEILEDPKADYRFRAYAMRKNVSRALAKIAESIDYPNFKDKVRETIGPDRSHLYTEVWSTMLGLQSGWRK